MPPEEKEYIVKSILRHGEGIEKSQIVMAFLTKDYKKSPDAVIDLGISMILDKPIYILAPEGTVIPENIKKVAKGIEFFKGHDDIQYAAKKLLGELI